MAQLYQSVITASALIILLVNFIYCTQGAKIVRRHILDRDQWWEAVKYDDKPRVFNWKEGDECPAEDFYLDCHDCYCLSKTDASCDRMSCDTPPQILNYVDGMECPAGKDFYSKCNDCKCHDDGKSATCTTKDCPELTTNEQESAS